MDKKIIFVAFAIEDQRQRDLLKGQSLSIRSPYEFTDMSVKEPYPQDVWKEKVRTRIRRSHGVIALISQNSSKSTGQKWEIQCALEEKKPVIGIWAYKDISEIQKLLLKTEQKINILPWSDNNISNFIKKA